MIEQYTPPRKTSQRLVAVFAALAVGSGMTACQIENEPTNQSSPNLDHNGISTAQAIRDLGSLAVKGRAPMTGYSRNQFGHGWRETNGCDTRNIILQRDLTQETLAKDNCQVQTGILQDPYTGKQINFVRGVKTSSLVQIDHIVALGDAWQTGAQQLSAAERENLANDPHNLQAVDGRSNEQKGDSDAASWQPSNKSERCEYATEQIEVKASYKLWVTSAEQVALSSILSTCPGQVFSVAQ